MWALLYLNVFSVRVAFLSFITHEAAGGLKAEYPSHNLSVSRVDLKDSRRLSVRVTSLRLPVTANRASRLTATMPDNVCSQTSDCYQCLAVWSTDAYSLHSQLTHISTVRPTICHLPKPLTVFATYRCQI